MYRQECGGLFDERTVFTSEEPKHRRTDGFFDVQIVSSCEGSQNKDYRRERKISLKEFTDSYQYRQLITADGCIVGIMDTNLDLSYCKKAVQPFWIGRGERIRREYEWTDHSWDHYARVSEREAYRLRWRG